MKVAFYGSSLLSSYWNGAATYYRGLLRDLALRGHAITFYEPDAFNRQAHRDIEPPDWARVVVYPATEDAARAVLAEASAAEVVVKASGVGVFDDLLLEGVIAAAAPHAITIFWDVDAAATLETMRQSGPDHPTRRLLPQLDMVLTYGGGRPVVDAYLALGARACIPIYNALDPATHHPAAPDPRFAADLGFLANRGPERERRVEEFFIKAGPLAPPRRFLDGGHVGTGEHNAFNTSPLAVLNVARDSMAEVGFSPATRVFEAAGAGACLITDAWEGIELFLQPGEEILVARDGRDVAEHLRTLTPDRARAIGERARARILAHHTYDRRAALLERVLADALALRRARA